MNEDIEEETTTCSAVYFTPLQVFINNSIFVFIILILILNIFKPIVDYIMS